MAVTQNTFTGDGSTQIFIFTFPYIEIADIDVTIDDVEQVLDTDFQFPNSTTVSFLTAPAAGTEVKIARNTAEDNMKHSFFPGSAIRAKDLNDNFTQAIYVVQEATFNTDGAVTAANGAVTTANAAETKADQALATATAASNEAETALDNVTFAQASASAAQTSASAAQASASAAQASAASAQNDAAAALTAAESIEDAVQSGPVLSVNGQSGTVGLLASDVGAATTAQGALADTAVQPGDLADVATTGSYNDLSDQPSLFSGDYNDLSNQPSIPVVDPDTVVTDSVPTFTATVQTTERTITAGAFDLSTGNHWTCGAITVPAPTNAVAGTSGLIRITAGPVVWNAVFKFPGGSAPTVSDFPALVPFYVQDSSNILMGNVAEGIA